MTAVERKGDRERDVKCTPDRTIINPDVLFCQDGVNGADMTQMKSRALVENAEKYARIFRPRSDIYSRALYRVDSRTDENL